MRAYLLVALFCLGWLSNGFAGELELKYGQPFCEKYECDTLVPEADYFTWAEDLKLPVIAAYQRNKLIAYLFLSIDLVNIPAYSGKPLVTLIAIDPKGIILAGDVVHHSEPIILVGIPESVLNKFVGQYVGHSISDHFEVVSTGFFGNSRKTAAAEEDTSDEESKTIKVDMVTGATVTIQVLDQTLLASARQVGQALGLVKSDVKRSITWESTYIEKSWAQLVKEGSVGHLRVESKEMDVVSVDGQPWLDVYFGDVSEPVTGINILGESNYQWLKSKLEPGVRAIFIVGNGMSSFKGSGFARGGLFDRFYIEQGNYKIIFRDLDHEHLYGVKAKGAPEFKESGIFFVKHPKFDSSLAWQFYLVASRLTGETALSKIFKTFSYDYQFPEKYFSVSLQQVEQPSVIKRIWQDALPKVILLSGFLLLTMVIISQRTWLSQSTKRLSTIHLSVLALSVIIIGLILQSPPSMTHLYPLIRVFEEGFRLDLYLTDPLQFVFWCFIAVSLFLWGRGWFCGWVCPYGALIELANWLTQKLHPRLGRYELSQKSHQILNKLRYVIFFFLVIVSLISIEWAERL
ncbi:MAG: 4Fe-4S binding protein, partial [Gammaproteobacteria bacterium]|nr:4Fe-4S binding protein [Gammaproteobacteria bacterium]